MHTHTHTHGKLLIEKKEIIKGEGFLRNGEGDSVQNTKPNFVFHSIWDSSIVKLGRESYKLLPPFQFSLYFQLLESYLEIQKDELFMNNFSF